MDSGKFLRARTYFFIDCLNKVFELMSELSQIREVDSEMEKRISEINSELKQNSDDITKMLMGEGKNVYIPLTEKEIEEKRLVLKFKNDRTAQEFQFWFNLNENKFKDWCQNKKLNITNDDFLIEDL